MACEQQLNNPHDCSSVPQDETSFCLAFSRNFFTFPKTNERDLNFHFPKHTLGFCKCRRVTLPKDIQLCERRKEFSFTRRFVWCWKILMEFPLPPRGNDAGSSSSSTRTAVK